MKILTASNNTAKYAAIQEVYGPNNSYLTFRPPHREHGFLEDELLVTNAKNKCNDLITHNMKNKINANKIVAIEGGYIRDNSGYYMIDIACKYENFEYFYGSSNKVRISKTMYEVATMGLLDNITEELCGLRDITKFISQGFTDGKKGFMEALIRCEKTTNTTGSIESLTTKDFSDTASFKSLELACQNKLSKLRK